MSGNISNRGEIRAAPWRLIQDHQWLEYKELKLPWLRPVVGYGPDLLQYAFLLESSPIRFAGKSSNQTQAHFFSFVQGWICRHAKQLILTYGLLA